MLLTSSVFLFIVLPVTLAVYFSAGGIAGPSTSKWWLCLASSSFYGWWSPPLVIVLVSSVIVNYPVSQGFLKLAKLPVRQKLFSHLNS